LSNHPPTPPLYTLSLHDALPIFLDAHDSVTAHTEGFKSLEEYRKAKAAAAPADTSAQDAILAQAAEIQKQRDAQKAANAEQQARSEEHTSERQSRGHLVCRLLLE